MDKQLFIKIILALKNIEEDYFKLKTTYNHEGIVRERVFCYEFYHQLRLLSDDTELTFNGEPDKSGHPDFNSENPDFIFHIPGKSINNYLTVEVKGTLDESKIKKDFKKIDKFISDYNYKFGLFILFNHEMDDLRTIFDTLKEIENKDKIYILAIKNAGEEPEFKKLNELLQ